MTVSCVCVSVGISTGKEKSDFLAEIDMMKKIAEGYSPHIVNMVGCVTLREPLCLITEFVPYGDLLSYLKYQRKKVGQQREGGRERGRNGWRDGWMNRWKGWDGQMNVVGEEREGRQVQSREVDWHTKESCAYAGGGG